MKIKLDENLPEQLAGALSELGHDTDTVLLQNLVGRNDEAIWMAAQVRRFLITQDLDFSDIRKFAPGTHAGLLHIRLRVPGRMALAERIQSLFVTEDVSTWSGCLVVATERKVRVRRPETLARSSLTTSAANQALSIFPERIAITRASAPPADNRARSLGC